MTDSFFDATKSVPEAASQNLRLPAKKIYCVIGSCQEEPKENRLNYLTFYFTFDNRTICCLPNACCDTIVLAEACQECAKQKILRSVVCKQQLKSGDKKNSLSCIAMQKIFYRLYEKTSGAAF